MHHLPKRHHRKRFHINDRCILGTLAVFVSTVACSSILFLVPNKNKFPPDPEKPLLFNVTLHRKGSNTTFAIDIHRGALFVNLRHSNCPLNRDRMAFIEPKIDKILQIGRSFKIPIVQHVSMNDCEEGILSCQYQLRRGKKAVVGGRSIVGEVQARSSEITKHADYFIGKDKCIYSGYDAQIEDNFCYAQCVRDVFITDIRNAIYAIAGVGAKYVFIAGEFLNNDLVSVIFQASQVGITPVIVDGLVDCEYNYEEMKQRASRHEEFIKKSISSLTGSKAYSTTYSELISSLKMARIKPKPVSYLKTNCTATLFKTL